MIQIIESITGPIRCLSKQIILPGTIVSFCSKDSGNVIVSDGSDKVRPFGIVGDEINVFNLLSVHYESMILRTSCLEPVVAGMKDYYPGVSLYCSRNGKITSAKLTESTILLGHVIAGPPDGVRFIEMNWI